MNKWMIISSLAALLLTACEQDQIGRYDLEHYLWFTQTVEQDTTISFSNYRGKDSHDLYFEVNLMGPLLTAPLEYALEVVDSMTTASPEQYDFDLTPSFGALRSKDSLRVTFHKTLALKDREDTLVIAIAENAWFRPAFPQRRYIRVCFNDKDAAPLWWDATFIIYFGPYSLAKYDALCEMTRLTDFSGVEEPMLRKYAIELKAYIKEHGITDQGKEIVIPVN